MSEEVKTRYYTAPDGKIYEFVGISEDLLPEFGSNEDGDLSYKYHKNQEEYEFTVNNDGDLQSDIGTLSILEDGSISTNTHWELVNEPATSDTMQKHIDLLRSHNKKIQIRATLLNENYAVEETLTGRLQSITYDMQYDSDIRRTCSLVMSIPRKEQIQLNFEKTWNKRVVELSCGIYSDKYSSNDFNYSFTNLENELEDTPGYVWYGLGRMLMSSGSTTYNATTQEVKLNLVDLMACMTQERGSQMGTTNVIYAGSNIKAAIEDFVEKYAEYKFHDICTFDDVMPYDLTSEIGDYPIDYLKKIIELFPYYEMFYNNSGQFVVQEIPTKISDPVDIGPSIIDDLIISENKSVDFAEIKNTTEIWGRELSGDYVATNVTTSNGCYNVTIDGTIDTLVSGEKYTILPPTDSVAGQTMKIENTTAYQIYTSNGTGTVYTPIEAGAMKALVPYVIRYFEEKFILEGELQVRCIVQEIKVNLPEDEDIFDTAKEYYKQDNSCNNIEWVVNPDSAFGCWIDPTTGLIQGVKKQVLEGGEYENIYTTQLALERAKYETWLKCRMQDTVEIEMILIPWMDINQKIQYTSPISGEVGTWIVQGISYNFDNWTMTVKAARFYPYYPW